MVFWIKNWVEKTIRDRSRRSEIESALGAYPIYNPPHRQSPNFLRMKNADPTAHTLYIEEFTQRSDENFRYFLDQKSFRIEALRGIIRWMDISNNFFRFDDAELQSISQWNSCYAGLLMWRPSTRKSQQIFLSLSEPWSGRWRGFNVMFDIGIFMGEWIIAHNRKRKWSFRIGSSDGALTTADII